MSEPKLEKIYSWMGPIYNFIYSKLAFDEGRKKSIEFLELQPGQRILEVGVGTGLTLPLYPSDCLVTGIDLSDSMLKEAHQLIEKHELDYAKVLKMNANHLEFADNSFDRVLGNLFISATQNPVGALLEMKRVCRPNGIIVLMNHFKAENPLIAQIEVAINPLSKKLGFTSTLELEPLLDQAHLKIKRLEKVNFMGLWTAVSMINHKSPHP